MATEVFIHKMTEHMESAVIVSWLAREGDRVKEGQAIMEVEMEKATVELEAPASGVLKGIREGVVGGTRVGIGETLAFIAAPDETVPSLPPLGTNVEEAKKAAAAQGPVDKTHPEGQAMTGGNATGDPGIPRATPVARRVARELNVDLYQVKGSGPEGRIREEDVRLYAQTRSVATTEAVQTTATAETSEVTITPAGDRQPDQEVEWLELSTLQRITGERMQVSFQTAPQFVLSMEADMTHALMLKKDLSQEEESLSITALLVKACAQALKLHPLANASFEGGRIKLFKRIHIGVAVGSEDPDHRQAGLIVPVIHDADRKILEQINREIKAFHEKAHEGRSQPGIKHQWGMHFSIEELSGGTFTISNLGMYGVTRFQAILNPPQSAILAVGQIIRTPVGSTHETNSEIESIVLRPMMSLTLTIDHRVLDGLQATRFLAELVKRLEHPYRLLQE